MLRLAVCGWLHFVILAVHVLLSTAGALQSPIICEDTIDGQPPFKEVDEICILGCGQGTPIATGSLLPGSVNTTAIPYCVLDCVRDDATPAQSSAAPGCNQQCRERNSGTPEQLGWCMYWCVEGGSIASAVVSTTCVPSLEYTPVLTSTVDPGLTATVEGFTQPPAWLSWYQTQTVIPRTTTYTFGSGVTSTMPVTTAASLAGSSSPSTIPSSTASAGSSPSSSGQSSTGSGQLQSEGSTATSVGGGSEAKSGILARGIYHAIYAMPLIFF